MMDKLFAEIVWIGFAYVFGSIPFGLILSKLVKGIDLREVGSKNIGATNVARTLGTKYGVITFILDMSKGLIPLVIATFMSHSAIFITLVALASLMGHLYPIFLNFKGGKGVATTIGIFLAISPGATILGLIPSVLLIIASGYVSLGSLTFVSIMPITFILGFKFSYIPLCLIIVCFIYSRHKENILRLAKGIENPWKKNNPDKE